MYSRTSLIKSKPTCWKIIFFQMLHTLNIIFLQYLEKLANSICMTFLFHSLLSSCFIKYTNLIFAYIIKRTEMINILTFFKKFMFEFVFFKYLSCNCFLKKIFVSLCLLWFDKLLLGTWSYLYLFSGPCCCALNFYFVLWIFETVDNLLLSFLYTCIVQGRKGHGIYMYYVWETSFPVNGRIFLFPLFFF